MAQGAAALAPGDERALDEQAPGGELVRPSGLASRMIVQLGASGLVVTRGQDRLGAGCQRVAIGAAPSLPAASVTQASVRECLVVAGATSHPYVFEAEPEITFARVAPILEVLDDLGTVSIGTAAR